MPKIVQPSVSVVIPTWNRAHTVGRAIESALRQSFPVLEVLVCDDGSNDDTVSVVASIAESDGRVRWIEGKRGGRPAIPRNRGLRESRGEWLAFLDSDDEWLPGKIELQLAAAWDLGSLAVSSNALRVGADGRELGILLDWKRARLRLHDLLVVNRVVCSSSVFHRSLLSKIGGFREEAEFKHLDDYALWLRIAALTDFAYCSEPLVRYCDDPGHSIRNDPNMLSAETQQALVLAATRNWLLAGKLDAAARLRALSQVGLAECRLAVLPHARKIKRKLFK